MMDKLSGCGSILQQVINKTSELLKERTYGGKDGVCKTNTFSLKIKKYGEGLR